MKRFGTPWLRQPDPPRAIALLLGLLVTGIVASGCVTSGTHEKVVHERDQLNERVKRLEASRESLDAERVALIDELEDLNQTQSVLSRDVKRLRKAESELRESLTVREAELADRRKEVGRLRNTYAGLIEDLEAEVAEGAIEIRQLRDGLQLNLSQNVLFPPGSSRVNAGGRVVLGKVADRVKSTPHRVVVRGHTDNVPIGSDRFPSNWELAGARASGVVRILREHGVAPNRLEAVSRGEFDPIASNDDAKGRAKNRRIEITLVPMAGAAPQAPAQSDPSPQP
jgi:chemotaxis protein MotB